MPITAELIDQTITTAKEFERSNIGIKNGADFPTIATELLKSAKFNQEAEVQGLMGLMNTFLIPKKKDNEKLTEQEAKDSMKAMAEIPKQSLAFMFYVGYRIGKQVTETEQLDKLYGEVH